MNIRPRWRVLFTIACLCAFCIAAGCATSSVEERETDSASDEPTVSALEMMGGADLFIRVRPRAASELASRFLGGRETAREIASVLEHVDEQEGILIGLRAQRHEALQKRARLGAGWWVFDQFEGRLAARALVSSDAPDKLEAAIRDYCRSGEDVVQTEACPRLTRIEKEGRFISLRLRLSPEKEDRSPAPWKPREETAPKTPAWKAFVDNGGPVAAYVSFERLHYLRAFESFARAQNRLDESGVREGEFAWFREGLGVVETYITRNWSGEEFEDIALVTRSFADEGQPTQVTADLIATKTTLGREVHQVGPVLAVPESRIEQTVVDLAWRGRSQEALSNIVSLVQELGEETTPRVEPIGRKGRRGALEVLTANPEGDILAPSLLESPLGYARSIADILASRNPEAASGVAEWLSAILQHGVPTGVSVVAGSLGEGAPDNSADVVIGVVLRWPAGSFDQPPAISPEIGGAAVDSRFESSESEDRLLLAVRSTVDEVFALDGAAKSIEASRAEIDLASLLALFPDIGNKAGFAALRQLAPRLELSEFSTEQTLVIRAVLGERPTADIQPPDYTVEGFEATQPSPRWTVCTHANLLDAYESARLMERVERNDRFDLLSRLMGEINSRVDLCKEHFPRKFTYFKRLELSYGLISSSVGMTSLRYSSLIGARSHFAKSCKAGVEEDCDRRKALDKLDGFRPPLLAEESRDPKGERIWLLVDGEGVIAMPDFRATSDWLDAVFDGERMTHDAFLKRVKQASQESDAKSVVVIPDDLTPAGDLARVLAASSRLVERRGAYMKGRYGGFVPFDVSEASAPSAPTVSVDARGVTLFGEQGELPPIDGCPSDGPTICVENAESARHLLDESGEGDDRSILDVKRLLLEVYRPHVVYDQIDQLTGVPRSASTDTRLTLRVSPDIPAFLVAEIWRAVKFRRDGAPFENRRAYEAARPQVDSPYVKELDIVVEVESK